MTRAKGMEEGAFVAEVDVTPDSLFFEDGAVPAWIGIEYMAQTVALYAGFEASLAGREPRPGLLLGARTYTSARAHFFPGETLRIVAHKVLEQDNGISAMNCIILGPQGIELARAELTVLRLPDMDALDALERA